MPDDANQPRIETVWVKFVGNLREALIIQADDRPLDQYLSLRDEVLALVNGPEFLSQLTSAWVEATTAPLAIPTPELFSYSKFVDAVIHEMEASAREIEVIKATTGERNRAAQNLVPQGARSRVDRHRKREGHLRGLFQEIPDAEGRPHPIPGTRRFIQMKELEFN